MLIVTLGIYALYWIYMSFKELKDYRGQGVHPIVGLLLALIPVTIFLLPSYVGRTYAEDGQSKPITGWSGLWAIVPLVGGLIWFVVVQSHLGAFWSSKAGAVAAQVEAPEEPSEPTA